MTVTSSSAAAVRRNLFGVNVVVEDTMDMDMAMDHLSGQVCAMDVSPKCCHSHSSRHHRHRASASTLRYAWRAMMRSIVGRERHHGQQQRQQGGALVADSVEC